MQFGLSDAQIIPIGTLRRLGTVGHPFENMLADTNQLVVLVGDLDITGRAPAFRIDLGNLVVDVIVSPKNTGFRNRIRSYPSETGTSSDCRVWEIAMVEAVDINPTISAPCAISFP